MDDDDHAIGHGPDNRRVRHGQHGRAIDDDHIVGLTEFVQELLQVGEMKGARPGLSTSWPAVMTSRFSIVVFCTACSQGVRSLSKCEKPRSRSRSKSLCKVGRRRSPSISKTRRPAWASLIARLLAEVDLPSPEYGLVTTTTWSR